MTELALLHGAGRAEAKPVSKLSSQTEVAAKDEARWNNKRTQRNHAQRKELLCVLRKEDDLLVRAGEYTTG